MIAERRTNGLENRNDFLSRLMAARDEGGKAYIRRCFRRGDHAPSCRA
jgi:cytochrome P450